ncbi:MAG: ArsR family transcriptional regulator [Candidatus Cloacimonetes bacterium]|nr:ArsR family transcriptional regulator [Candidatus Cloacimonadota bacterium]
MEAAKTIILEAMKKSGKPLKAGEISELTGVDKKEVDKILKNLKNEELIDSPKRCYYEVK